MKRTYKNVSRSKTLITCTLADGTSMYIPYGASMTVEESQLTDYLKRRIAARDLREIKSVSPTPSFKKDVQKDTTKDTEKKK